MHEELFLIVGYVACGVAALVAVLCIAALPFRPRPLQIRFGKRPPVVAWVNAPSKGATPRQRTVWMPTKASYLIPTGSRGHFVLVFEWKVRVRLEGRSEVLVIPDLTTTDFASIPRVLHSLLSPLNNTIYAAILHDYLYRDPAATNAARIDKKTADRIFYWGMRAKGVTRLTAGVMYLGVLLFGHSSYRRS